ncbi:unnamed protein product [Allacma fusca]|uniref:Malonyl-CoA:ACP transacylase (MAT) domain-containing protein n=1 Tax=Allacma fusca TaxID=39272 RepID=A0A8J2JF18_9HEXA|nr:unnamed protein product [Allacma fusca]
MSKNTEIWFIFPGMGRTWEGMEKSILNLEPFRESIQSQAQTLKLFNVDLFQLLFPNQRQESRSSLELYTVCVTAVQIAFIDLLKSFKIYPTGIVGHSVGEIACAYSDGCSTRDETIKIAYAHAKACRIARSIPGAMVSVGLSAEDISERLHQRSKQLFLACYNSPISVTISGPESEVTSLANELQEEGVFVKQLYCAGLAQHTELIQANAEEFERNLKTFASVTQKLRTNRWKSTSVCEKNWDSDAAKFYSSDYLVKNMVNPVLFQQAIDHIPKNAIVVEIASLCNLQCVLRHSLPNHRILCLGLKNREDDLITEVYRSINELLIFQPNPQIQILVDQYFGICFDNYNISRSIRNEANLLCETSAIEFFVNLILRKSTPQTFRVAQVIHLQPTTALATVRQCVLLNPSVENLELHIIMARPDLEDCCVCPEIFKSDKISINFLNLHLFNLPIDLLILDSFDFSTMTHILENTHYVILKGNSFSKIPPGFKCFARKRMLGKQCALFQRLQGNVTLF